MTAVAERDMTFGEALRLQRKLARTTQRVIAERAGISRQHLSDIENGKADPSADVTDRLIGAIAGSYR